MRVMTWRALFPSPYLPGQHQDLVPHVREPLADGNHVGVYPCGGCRTRLLQCTTGVPRGGFGTSANKHLPQALAGELVPHTGARKCWRPNLHLRLGSLAAGAGGTPGGALPARLSPTGTYPTHKQYS